MKKIIEKKAEEYASRFSPWLQSTLIEAFTKGAEEVSKVWKDAQGDDLPEIDREVVALQGRKVVFAHRPPEYWDSKNIDTGEVTRYCPQTYDKGGWNMPDVKYWLDVELPKIEEQ